MRCRVAAGLVSLGFVVTGSPGREASAPAAPGIVASPVGRVVAKVPIPAGTGGFAVGEGAVWAVSDAVPVLTRIDPKRNARAASIKLKLHMACPPLAPGCGEVAAGDGSVWVAHALDNDVTRVDPQTNKVVASIKVGSEPRPVAFSPGAVWAVNGGADTLSRISPSKNRTVKTIRIGPVLAANDRMGVTAAGGVVWVSLPTRHSVIRVDARTNRIVKRIHTAAQVCGFLAGNGAGIWASTAHCGHHVFLIDQRTNRVTRQVRGKLQAPIGVAFGLGSLWIADLDAQTIDRVDPRTGRMLGRLHVGGQPVRIAVGFGSVWVRDDSGRVLRIQPS